MLLRLGVGAVLVGGVGCVDGVGSAVRLDAVLAWRHSLVYSVQTTCFLETLDLVLRVEALDS